MGLNWLKTKKPQRRENLFFTVKSSRGFGTHLIDLGRMKGWINLGATSGVLNLGALDWESSTLTTKAIAPWKLIRWKPFRITILYTVSIIHKHIDLSRTLDKPLAFVSLESFKDFDRLDWGFIFSGISFSFVNLVIGINSFTWFK